MGAAGSCWRSPRGKGSSARGEGRRLTAWDLSALLVGRDDPPEGRDEVVDAVGLVKERGFEALGRCLDVEVAVARDQDGSDLRVESSEVL